MPTGAAGRAVGGRLNGWNHFALAERAARFGYWRLTFADGAMFWSEGFYRLLGTDGKKQLPDLRWLLRQLKRRDFTNLRRRIEDAIAGGAPFHVRVRARSELAPAQVVDIDGETETDSGGHVIAIVGVCTDVTAQVKAESERELAQERYRMMAEESSDIIVLYENGRAVCASHALRRILDLEPWQLEGGHYLDVVHPDDRLEAAKLRGRPTPGEIWTASYRARHSNGEYVWIEASTRGVETVGDVHREITVARDITERKKQEHEILAARERAEAASRAKSLFLANMSHELRTPLNAIIGFAEVMRDHVFGALGNRRYEEYATEIYNSGRFLLNQFCDILDMARIEGGMFELEPEKFDVTDTARDCIRQMGAAADARGLVLEADFPSGASWLFADRRAVKQILLNLLSNSVKFTGAGGRVGLEVRANESGVELIVSDSGAGIPDGAIDRLGRPFEQVCADPHLAKSGQGLGLALVHALTRKHGGMVAITSREGNGTVVRVALPAKAARVAA